jgi:hypothetical protein
MKNQNEKLFRAYWRDRADVFILAKTKVEALVKYKKYLGYGDSAIASKEEKGEWSSTFATLKMDESRLAPIARMLASASREGVAIIPEELTKIPTWEAYFDGKFFFKRDLEEMNKTEEIYGNSEKYKELKEKLTQMVEDFKEDDEVR